MLTAWSAASRSRLSCSCRSAPGRIVRPAVAAPKWAVISDANLGFSLRAAQEFYLIDPQDAERLRALQLRARVGAHYHGRGFLGDAVGKGPPRRFDQLLGLRARQRRQRPRDHVRLPGEWAPAFGRRRLLEVQAELVEPFEQLAVLGLVEEPEDGLRDRFADAGNSVDGFGGGVPERLHRAEVAGGELGAPGAPRGGGPRGQQGRGRAPVLGPGCLPAPVRGVLPGPPA